MGKKSKIRVYRDSEKKENRKPYVVGPDAHLELGVNGVRGLLNMGLSKEAYSFVLANISSKPNDELARFRVNAQRLRENAESNKHVLTLNATPTEIKMKMLLTELGVRYEFQKIYYVGYSFYIVDFYLPDHNLVVEIDGQQHYAWNAKVYDKLRTDNLINLHSVKRVVRFDNKDLTVDTYVKERLLKEFDIK